MKRKLSFNRESEIKFWKRASNEILNSLKSRQIFVNLSDSYTFMQENECIRAVSETIGESAARNLLLKCMVDAEAQSPGASLVMLHHMSGRSIPEEFRGLRFCFDDLKTGLLRLTDHDTAEICVEVTKLAGRRGKIFLDPSASSYTEISYGSQICKWKPIESFFASVGLSRVSVQNCRAVFVDGIIESVSECHKIFHESYESKTPIVVFARGFSEEVVATASVNFQRQTAQVIPVLIPFDEVGVNGFGDLAGCFGCEVISADKGQLISNIDVRSFPLVERISCSSAGTEIEYSNNQVEKVSEKLIKKLNSSDSAQVDLVKRRIDFLGSGLITIKVGNEKKSLTGIQRDRIDFGLRYIKQCMKHGVVKIDDFIIPSSSISAGIKCSLSFSNIITNCKVVLEVDRCG
jgi:hypothetical protein